MKKNLINDQKFLNAMEEFNHFVYQYDLDLYGDEKYVGLYYSEKLDSFIALYVNDNELDDPFIPNNYEWSDDYHLVYYEDVCDMDEYWHDDDIYNGVYILSEDIEEDMKNFVQNRIDKIQKEYNKIAFGHQDLLDYSIDQYNEKIINSNSWEGNLAKLYNAKEDAAYSTCPDIVDSIIYEVDNEDYPIMYGHSEVKEEFGVNAANILYFSRQNDINEQFYVIKNLDLINGLKDSPYVIYQHDDTTAFIRISDKDRFRFSEEIYEKLKTEVDKQIETIIIMKYDLDQVLAAADAVEDQGRDHSKQSNLER